MTSQIYVSGANDDLIHVEGDVSKEFYKDYPGDEREYIVMSNGVVVSIEYDGDWRVKPEAVPDDASVGVVPAGSHDDDRFRDYSDVVEIESERPVDWVAISDTFERVGGGE